MPGPIPRSTSSSPGPDSPGLPLHYAAPAPTGPTEDSFASMHQDPNVSARRRAVGRDAAPWDGDALGDEAVDDDSGKTGKELLGEKAPPRRGFISRRAPAPQRREPTWRDLLPTRQELLPHLPPLLYTIASAYTRYRHITYENSVVWDEAHFGKFGSHYLKREFYFDVHPPLGKMLVGLAGALAGYNGSFDFKSGTKYPDNVNYGAMRVMLATFGVLMVPLAWYTSLELGLGKRATHLVTLMVLFDCAWATISRFILLDSMLLFFTCTTVFFLTKFHNERKYPFEFDWWMWLILTGYSIGCVTSVKWVGLFVTALVGLYTIEDLWDKFGDLSMPKETYIRHWLARGACLIALPAVVYMASFKLHFIILNHSGPGDAQMSSLFQANLKGNDFHQNPLEAAFGSKVTLKQMGYGGGLLHSHVQTFPVGSQQQQVTCYHYKDNNNDWIITPTWEDKPLDPNDELRFLQNGDSIRLVHAATGRNLHSHPVVAPITKLHNEVAGYGNATVGDSNDYWIVEVVDDTIRGKLKKKSDRIHSLTTRMRFRHRNSGCYLRAANVNLPEWGFKQIEVTCDKDNNPKDVHTYWNIESHWNDRLPAGNAKLYRSPFFKDFWHLNVAMMTSNNALVPNPDKHDVLASEPTDWPFLHLGLRMNGWGDLNAKYYLLGNPVVWWASSASLGLFVVVVAWYLLRMQRKFKDFQPGEWDAFLHAGKMTFGGWALHYFPFLIMGRVTYLHHYLPALYFAVLMLGFLLDHLVFKNRRLPERVKWAVFAAAASAVVGTFLHFRGVVFGMVGPVRDYKGLQWRRSWNIYD